MEELSLSCGPAWSGLLTEYCKKQVARDQKTSYTVHVYSVQYIASVGTYMDSEVENTIAELKDFLDE